MSTLRYGLALALSAGLALTIGAATASAEEAEGPVGEASQAFTVSPCTLGGGVELGTLEVITYGPNVVQCYRTSAVVSGGQPAPSAPPGVASCWSIAKSLGCPGF